MIKFCEADIDIDKITIQAAVNEVEEFKDVREKLSEEAEDRLTDFLVAKMRTILEQVIFACKVSALLHEVRRC